MKTIRKKLNFHHQITNNAPFTVEENQLLFALLSTTEFIMFSWGEINSTNGVKLRIELSHSLISKKSEKNPNKFSFKMLNDKPMKTTGTHSTLYKIVGTLKIDDKSKTIIFKKKSDDKRQLAKIAEHEELKKEYQFGRRNNLLNMKPVIIFSEENSCLIELELQGSILEQFVSNNTLSIDDGLNLILDLLKMLKEQLHEYHLVHRDLSPDNIFVANMKNQKVPMVLDYASSKDADVQDRTDWFALFSEVPGNLNYIPPLTYLLRHGSSFRTDLFTLGFSYFIILKKIFQDNIAYLDEVHAKTLTQCGERILNIEIPMTVNDAIEVVKSVLNERQLKNNKIQIKELNNDDEIKIASIDNNNTLETSFNAKTYPFSNVEAGNFLILLRLYIMNHQWQVGNSKSTYPTVVHAQLNLIDQAFANEINQECDFRKVMVIVLDKGKNKFYEITNNKTFLNQRSDDTVKYYSLFQLPLSALVPTLSNLFEADMKINDNNINNVI